MRQVTPKGMRAFYVKFGKAFSAKPNKLLIEITIAATAGYFALKKYFDFSISQWIAYIFAPPAVPWVIGPLGVVIAYSVVGKIFMLVFDSFPASKVNATEAAGLNHCCLRINGEITRHIQQIAEDPKGAIAKFTAAHSFDINVAMVVEALSLQIRSTLDGIRKRDIFISVYVVPAFADLKAPRETIEYLTHFPEDRDWVRSQVISLDLAGPFKDYECVKAISSAEETRIDFQCADYAKTESKRHKTVAHYIGMKISCQKILLGFLNIEFHNNKFFASDSEMAEYVEQHLIAFRYLVVYQFLKKVFFRSVALNLLNPLPSYESGTAKAV